MAPVPERELAVALEHTAGRCKAKIDGLEGSLAQALYPHWRPAEHRILACWRCDRRRR